MTEPTPPPTERLTEAGPDVVIYLEKMLLDAYKREFDQEENVWRTLPLFATSIGLLAGLATLLHSTLPKLTWSWFPVLTYSELAGMFGAIAALFFFLFHAARRRRIHIPIEELPLIDHASALADHYHHSRSDPADLDEAVLFDLRRRLLLLIADATVSTRDNNNARVSARARATYALGVALAFAFVLIITIFLHDALN
jgi:uncharacterized membrane protein